MSNFVINLSDDVQGSYQLCILHMFAIIKISLLCRLKTVIQEPVVIFLCVRNVIYM